jgi:hypothetical protein
MNRIIESNHNWIYLRAQNMRAAKLRFCLMCVGLIDADAGQTCKHFVKQKLKATSATSVDDTYNVPRYRPVHVARRKMMTQKLQAFVSPNLALPCSPFHLISLSLLFSGV